jgi:hypothetical protein
MKLGAFLRRKSASGAVGLVTAALGAFAFAFTVFSMVVLGLVCLTQTVSDPGTETPVSLLAAVWQVWMPLAALGSAVAVTGGLLLHADHPIGRRLAQAACLYALAWSVGYFFGLGPYMDAFVREAGAVREEAVPVVRVIALFARLSVFGTVGPLAVGLLWALRARKP